MGFANRKDGTSVRPVLPVATLVYDKPAGPACPEEARFRAAVSTRLGRDPFVAQADRAVVVRLSGAGSSWQAVIRIDGDEASDERRIEGSGSCEELATGAALAVSIAIDPQSMLDPPPAEAPPEPAPKPAPSLPAPPPRPELTSPPTIAGTWHLRAAARGWLGAVPHVSGGPLLGARYRHPDWSLGLAGFAVLPRREAGVEDRAVSASLWSVELEPCALFSAFRGCALLQGGRLRAEGQGVDVSLSQSSWHTAVGASLGYELSLGRFALVPVLSGAARLQTTTLTLAGAPVWLTPRWLVSAGFEVDYRL